jgi:hypothetical protein
MAKKKKQKKPNIPIEVLARPRLEGVLQQYQTGKLDTAQYLAAIQQLMDEIGQEAILGALVGLLDGSSNEQKDALMVAIPKLGNEQTIAHLWHLVQKSKLSTSAKMTALIILQAMGEDVDLDDPGQYFSWRDLKSGNLTEVTNLGRFATREIIKDLRRQSSMDDVEAALLRFQSKLLKRGNGPLLTMIEDLISMGDTEAADMLMGLVATGNKTVREAARQGLLKLSAQKIYPQSTLIKSLIQEQFHSAYSTDPAHPWQQQQVIIVFKRGENLVQALHFLLDFGQPWRGSIKDMFPSRTVSFSEYKREFLDESAMRGTSQRQIPYSRARQFILDAVKANRKNKQALPPEYDQYYHWVERRIIDPSPETLAYAAQVDARTPDEWGELDGQPMRGMSIITHAEGKETPVVYLGDDSWDDLDDLDESELEEIEFADLLERVREFYESGQDDVEVNYEEILPCQWVLDYFQDGYEKGETDVDELGDQWIDIGEFIYFLGDGEKIPTSLETITGEHLSDFVTDYWDGHILVDPGGDFNERRRNVETIRSFYLYLGRQNRVSASAAKRVSQAANALLRAPDKITPISK